MTCVVVDTNILFSILLRKRSRLRDVLFSSTSTRFYCCRFTIVELFKHKSKLMKYSAFSEEDLLVTFQDVLKRLIFHDELSMSPASIQTAFELCHDVDEKDTPFVALAIELDAVLWSGDKELREGLIKKGFDRFLII